MLLFLRRYILYEVISRLLAALTEPCRPIPKLASIMPPGALSMSAEAYILDLERFSKLCAMTVSNPTSVLTCECCADTFCVLPSSSASCRAKGTVMDDMKWRRGVARRKRKKKRVRIMDGTKNPSRNTS